ncbi:putative glycoprotein [Hubei coleoptera virus 3]|uniref:Putative glycoprotein n=1 Tax=Hubei coleoptera virus 3 TaxID=1922862 RepID=A0A1L3KMZ8_9VIRU|nr:putative glycoprotein [Hubei coleoptera virus 3]APG78685.1 putative glycoprotein [Hubei coleoptera virus 3]
MFFAILLAILTLSYGSPTGRSKLNLETATVMTQHDPMFLPYFEWKHLLHVQLLCPDSNIMSLIDALTKNVYDQTNKLELNLQVLTEELSKDMNNNTLSTNTLLMRDQVHVAKNLQAFLRGTSEKWKKLVNGLFKFHGMAQQSTCYHLVKTNQGKTVPTGISGMASDASTSYEGDLWKVLHDSMTKSRQKRTIHIHGSDNTIFHNSQITKPSDITKELRRDKDLSDNPTTVKSVSYHNPKSSEMLKLQNCFCWDEATQQAHVDRNCDLANCKRVLDKWLMKGFGQITGNVKLYNEYGKTVIKTTTQPPSQVEDEVVGSPDQSEVSREVDGQAETLAEKLLRKHPVVPSKTMADANQASRNLPTVDEQYEQILLENYQTSAFVYQLCRLRLSDNLQNCLGTIPETNALNHLWERLQSTHSKRIKRSSNRVKRAPLGIIGRLYKWLFGVATVDDVDEVRRNFVSYLKGQQNLSKANQEFMTNQLSINQHFDENLKILNTKISDTVKGMNSTIDMFMDTIQQTNNVFQDLYLTTKLSSLLIHGNILITGAVIDALRINQYMDSLSSRYLSLYHALLSDTLTAEILDPASLKTILLEINNKLPPNYQVIDLPDFRSWYKVSYSTVSLIDNSIVYAFKFPIVRKSSEPTLWHFNSLPVFKNGTAFKLNYHDHWVYLDEHNQEWVPMSQTDFNARCDKSTSVCSGFASRYTYSKNNYNHCLLSLLYDSSKVIDQCEMSPIDIDQVLDPIIAISIPPNQWLVETLYPVKAVKSCPAKSGQFITDSVMISGVMTIELAPLCKISIAELTLESSLAPPGLESQSYAPEYTLESVKISTSDIDIIALKENKVPQIDIKMDKSTWNTKAMQIKIKSVETNLNAQKELVSNISEINKKLQADLIKIESSSGKTFSSQWISFYWENIIFYIWVIILTLMTLRVYVRVFGIPLIGRGNGIMAKATFPLVSSSGFGTANAFPPQGKIYMDGSTIWASAPNATSNVMVNVTNKFNEFFSQPHNTTSVIHLCVMVALMLLMLILMYSLMCHHQSMLLRKLLSLGVLPINTRESQHIGEIGVQLYVLVMMKSMFGSKTHYAEVGIQMCTLPGNIRDWICTSNLSENKTFIVPKWVCRWSSTLELSCQWGPICLKSTKYPNVDTCKDLPKHGSFNMREVIEQINPKCPFIWKYISAVEVNKVILRTHNDYKEIYSYNSDTLS